MFSLGGWIVTDFRILLNPENTSMLVFVSQKYARVPSNLKDRGQTCEDEPYELHHVIPPPPQEKTQQKGKSKSKTRIQNKTKKRGAPEKPSPTHIPETQTGPEPEEQQQLQLETQECQWTPV